MKIQDELFWKKVDKQPNDCWEWKGGTTYSGYGLVTRRKIKNTMILSHRYAWYLKYGKFPDNLCCHTCDNPSCVNPDHLFEGSHKDNMEDMACKDRHGRSKLNKKDIPKIRFLLGKMKQDDIAALFEVSPTAITDIKKGKKLESCKMNRQQAEKFFKAMRFEFSPITKSKGWFQLKCPFFITPLQKGHISILCFHGQKTWI